MKLELTKYCCAFTSKKEMIAQHVTLSNALEGKYKKWNKF